MRRNVLFLALAFCTMTAQSALAQSELGLKRAGVAIGIVSPENLDAAFGFGVFADLGNLTPQIGLEPRIDYWSQSESVFGGGKFSVRDLTIGARGKYFFPTSNPKLRPFAGAGLGLHMLNAEVEIVDPFSGQTMTAEDSSTKLGLDLGGGFAAPLSPRTDLLAEIWYGIVSDFSQFSLRVGLSHVLGS